MNVGGLELPGGNQAYMPLDSAFLPGVFQQSSNAGFFSSALFSTLQSSLDTSLPLRNRLRQLLDTLASPPSSSFSINRFDNPSHVLAGNLLNSSRPLLVSLNFLTSNEFEGLASGRTSKRLQVPQLAALWDQIAASAQDCLSASLTSRGGIVASESAGPAQFTPLYLNVNAETTQAATQHTATSQPQQGENLPPRRFPYEKPGSTEKSRTSRDSSDSGLALLLKGIGGGLKRVLKLSLSLFAD